MASLETTPERDLSRAHWQRSEAAVVYGAVFDYVLGSIGGRISDDVIIDHLTELEAGSDALTVADHLAHLPYTMFSVADLPKFSTSMRFEKSTGRRISEFTYEGNALKTVDEGLKTAMAFPAFFLRVINQEHDKVYQHPLVKDLSDVHEIMASKDYSTMIHEAALAPNAFWPGVFSELPINTKDDHIWRSFFLLPTFVRDETSKLGFRLDTSPILEKLSENNQRGNSTLAPPHPTLDDLASSGCPVRLRRPQFTKSEQDQARLAELSRVTNRTVQDLQSKRQYSGIQAGLNFGAGLLWRAVILDQAKKIGR